MALNDDIRERVRARVRAGQSPSANGQRAGAQTRREPEAEAWPAPEPFPLDVLPSCLREYVSAVAEALPCPVDYAAVPLLALAGGAIGASRALRIKHGWHERPCVYAAIVAIPGSAKTPALKLLAQPIYREQSRLYAHYKRAVTAWDSEKDEDERWPKPVLSTIYVADTTTEALARILESNPRGVTMIRDELTAWVGSMDQYRARGRGSDRQFWLSAWAGEAIRVDRRSQEDQPVFVSHPFVSVVGGLPPAMLSRLSPKHGLEDGFLDRILFSYPKPAMAHGENWRAIPEELENAWEIVLHYLRNLKPEWDDDGQPRPHYVRFDTSGRLAWERFTTWLADQINTGPELMRGPLMKMRGYGARLTLIVHCLRMAGGEAHNEDVDLESMDRAAKLIRYFASHTAKVFGILIEADEEHERRMLIGLIRGRGGQITVRELMRASRRYRESAELALAALNGLVGAGLGHWEPQLTDGRPVQVFVQTTMGRH
jgi:hypothetical protein